MADPQHHVARIRASAACAPLTELLGEIAGRLTGEWGIGGAKPGAVGAMAARARGQTPRGVAPVIKGGCALLASVLGRSERLVGIEERDFDPLACTEVSRDPSHLRMVAVPFGVGIELPLQVSRVEAREAGGPRAVAFAVQPVAGKTSVRRPRARAAKRDQLAALAETIERSCLGGGASRQQWRPQNREDQLVPHATGQTVRHHAGFRCVLLALAVAACKPPPTERQSLAQGDPAKGRATIERVGCGSCHRIPGVDWPQGAVGPALTGMADRALIAGKLPNRPDVLAAYIRNAPELVLGSAMPAMPVTEMEARDIAAFLYQAEGQ